MKYFISTNFDILSIINPRDLGITDDLNKLIDSFKSYEDYVEESIGNIKDYENLDSEYAVEYARSLVAKEINNINGNNTLPYKLYIDNIIDMHLFNDGNYGYGTDHIYSHGTKKKIIEQYMYDLNDSIRSAIPIEADYSEFAVIILCIDVFLQGVPFSIMLE